MSDDDQDDNRWLSDPLRVQQLIFSRQVMIAHAIAAALNGVGAALEAEAGDHSCLRVTNIPTCQLMIKVHRHGEPRVLSATYEKNDLSGHNPGVVQIRILGGRFSVFLAPDNANWWVGDNSSAAQASPEDAEVIRALDLINLGQVDISQATLIRVLIAYIVYCKDKNAAS